MNVFISKDEYLGEPITVTYPRVDDLVNLSKEKGRGSLLFKRNLTGCRNFLLIKDGHFYSYCSKLVNNINYLDDFAGVEKPLFAHKAILELKELSLSCGIEESKWNF